MSRPSHGWEVAEEEAVAPVAHTQQTPPARPIGSLAWASAVGNQAVQRLARRTIAREVAAEERLEEAAAGPDAAEDAAPEPEVGEEAAPEPQAGEGPVPEEAGLPADMAPEEAAGLVALDDVAEDDLPE